VRRSVRFAPSATQLFGGHPPDASRLISASYRSGGRAPPRRARQWASLDCDGDRIARHCKTGPLLAAPAAHALLIDTSPARGLRGMVIKTVSGSDLMKLVARGLAAKWWRSRWPSNYIAAENAQG